MSSWPLAQPQAGLPPRLLHLGVKGEPQPSLSSQGAMEPAQGTPGGPGWDRGLPQGGGWEQRVGGGGRCRPLNTLWLGEQSQDCPESRRESSFPQPLVSLSISWG